MDRIAAHTAIAQILGSLGFDDCLASERAKLALAPTWGQITDAMPPTPPRGDGKRAKAMRAAFAAWLVGVFQQAEGGRLEFKASASGMSRQIKAHLTIGGVEREITSWLADATDHGEGPHGLRIAGCGMNMGFAVLCELAWAAWPCLPETLKDPKAWGMTRYRDMVIDGFDALGNIMHGRVR